jgi:hypothetical protein
MMRVFGIIDRRGSDILWVRGLPERALSLGMRNIRWEGRAVTASGL